MPRACLYPFSRLEVEKARDGWAFWAKGRESLMGAGSRVWTEHLWTLPSRCPGAAEERPSRQKGLRLAGARAELPGGGLEPRCVVNPSAKLSLQRQHIPLATRRPARACPLPRGRSLPREGREHVETRDSGSQALSLFETLDTSLSQRADSTPRTHQGAGKGCLGKGRGGGRKE